MAARESDHIVNVADFEAAYGDVSGAVIGAHRLGRRREQPPAVREGQTVAGDQPGWIRQARWSGM